MNRIDAYRFGSMVINGTRYTRDVLIFPDGTILCPWRRMQGHVLDVADLEDLISTEPDIIICGTGAMGIMRPTAALLRHMEACSIEFITLKSAKAVKTYNAQSGSRKTGACFHLTC